MKTLSIPTGNIPTDWRQRVNQELGKYGARLVAASVTQTCTGYYVNLWYEGASLAGAAILDVEGALVFADERIGERTFDPYTSLAS